MADRHRCPGDGCRKCEQEMDRVDDIDPDAWHVGQNRYERALDRMWEG